jgi:hypothetical protein
MSTNALIELIGTSRKVRIKGKKLPPKQGFGQACYSIFMKFSLPKKLKNSLKKPTKSVGYLFLLIGLLIPFAATAQVEDYRQTVITDPAISRRCSALIDQRQQKIDHKQKLRSLLERSKRLLQLTPPERKTLLDKLRKNRKRLTRELKLTLNQIQTKEENIIRKGCPGITL